VEEVDQAEVAEDHQAAAVVQAEVVEAALQAAAVVQAEVVEAALQAAAVLLCIYLRLPQPLLLQQPFFLPVLSALSTIKVLFT
jgi:hypothetical protein